MIEATRHLSVVESLAKELRDRGSGAEPDAEARSAAAMISEAIAVARGSVALRGDIEAARAFLNELAGNPEAELPDPGEPNIEYTKPVRLGPTPTIPHAPIEEPQPVPDAWPNPAIDPDGAWHRMHPSPVWR
jgi:hypothetical protein